MTREEAIWYLTPIAESASIERYKEALSMAIAALREQDGRENPKPLTLEELRQTHNPVWCSCELLDGGNGFWCLCINGKIIAPSGDSFDVEEIPNWVFLRSKPKEDA